MQINSLLKQISMNQAPAIYPSLTMPYLQQMDAIIKLEVALCGKEDILSIGWKHAIRSQVPAAVILQTVKDMAEDNYNGVANLIGRELTNKILAL